MQSIRRRPLAAFVAMDFDVLDGWQTDKMQVRPADCQTFEVHLNEHGRPREHILDAKLRHVANDDRLHTFGYVIWGFVAVCRSKLEDGCSDLRRQVCGIEMKKVSDATRDDLKPERANRLAV